MDREEFFRLKKIQSKKKRDTAVKEKEDKEKREREEAEYDAKYAAGEEQEKKVEEEVGPNLLQEKDEDGLSLPLFPSLRRLSRSLYFDRSMLTPFRLCSHFLKHPLLITVSSSSHSYRRLLALQPVPFLERGLIVAKRRVATKRGR